MKSRIKERHPVPWYKSLIKLVDTVFYCSFDLCSDDFSPESVVQIFYLNAQRTEETEK